MQRRDWEALEPESSKAQENVSDKIRKIEKKDYPMAIYDTPGFELSKGQQT